LYSEVDKTRPVVQKYGGTSVGTIGRIKAVARRVARFKRDDWEKLAIVVSAMSGETNRLVGLMKEANPEARGRTKSYDMAVSAGEQVSVGLMAAALEAEGIHALPFLAYQIGIMTDRSHGEAKIRSIQTDTIEKCWAAGAIPVIAGFQGITETMDLTTLGRGGSDTSAVALAAALGASSCEINTDVDGVFTADPRYIAGAKLIEELDYETALELAALGSKVLHSRCIEVAAKYRIPITVRNSFQADDRRRTRIMTFSDQTALEAPVVSGITLDENVARITVQGVPSRGKTLFLVFGSVASEGINVDIIVHNTRGDETKDRFGFTVQEEDVEAATKAIESLRVQSGFAELAVTTQRDLAKVSAVGLGMRSHSGVATRVFATLTKNNVDIMMVSTSEIKISCVVPGAQGKQAAQLLHDSFFEK